MQRWWQLEGRKHVVVVAVLSALLMIKPAPAANGAGESWKSWQAKGEVLLAQSERDEACKAFRHALAEALHSQVVPEDMLHLHVSLAAAYAMDGQFLEAETEFRRTLELEKTLHGTASLDYAMDLAGLLLLPTYSGGREEGIARLKLAIATHKGNANVTEILTAKDYLAKLLFGEGRFSEAESALLEAQASYEETGQLPAWTEAELLNDLSVIRERQGLYKEAAALDEQTIGLLERRFGKESSGLVTPLNNLATMYARMGRYREAEIVFARGADLCERTMGENHPLYGELLRNRSEVLRRLGKKKESRAMRAKADEVIEESNRRNGVGSTVSLAALRAER